MDNNSLIKEVIGEYKEIIIIEEKPYSIKFSLYEMDFIMLYVLKENEVSYLPVILIVDEENFEYPHIMYDNEQYDGHTYRSLCLFENESYINFLLTSKEKIVMVIEQLIHLLSLSKSDIEKEIQKEFLFYWNKQVDNNKLIDVYLNKEFEFQELNVYDSNSIEDQTLYFVSKGKNLNIKEKKFKFNKNYTCFYIPIVDNRGVLPPLKNRPWTSENILNIIKGKHIARITHNTYNQLLKKKTRSRTIYIIFEMIIKGISVNFGCKLSFYNNSLDNLVNKLQSVICSVTPIQFSRVDYSFLNKKIGNDTSIEDKKIAIIGAGSLGSYILTELSKCGLNKFTIYDDDLFSEQNIMRHTCKYYMKNFSKTKILKFEVESIHPEIHVNSVNKRIDSEELKNQMDKFDLIIFTVGNSQIQYECNRMFKENNYDKPVIYAWLEAEGKNSHILKVNYNKSGCFECLFTNNSGELVSNKVNISAYEKIENSKIRDGCGGTRVAYGNEILLKTTAEIINTVKNIFKNSSENNFLVNIQPDKISTDYTFVERSCKCCNGKN